MTGSAHTIGSFEVSDTDYYNVHFYADDHCSSTFITSWSDSFPSAGEPVIWNSNALMYGIEHFILLCGTLEQTTTHSSGDFCGWATTDQNFGDYEPTLVDGSTCFTQREFFELSAFNLSCSATEVANSDHAATGSISGVTGETVTVACDAGYEGSGVVTCGDDGMFTSLTCTAAACSATEVTNSDHAATGSISGVTGETVTVACDAGYEGSDVAICSSAGTFNVVSCTPVPTAAPTDSPTSAPTNSPTGAPTDTPMMTLTPVNAPTLAPTTSPSADDSESDLYRFDTSTFDLVDSADLVGHGLITLSVLLAVHYFS